MFLAVMFVLVVGMLGVYGSFLKDKPAIEAQQNQPVLSPDQMVSGVKNFINTTTSNIHPPNLGTP